MNDEATPLRTQDGSEQVADGLPMHLHRLVEPPEPEPWDWTKPPWGWMEFLLACAFVAACAVIVSSI